MKMLANLLIMTITSFVYADVNFDNPTTGGFTREDIKDIMVPGVKYGVPGSVRYTRDCARFTFGPSDGEIMSEKIWLRSEEYRTECYTTYVPGPNGQQIPQQHCYENLYMTYRRAAQINIKPRKLYPWERETFEVCLEGEWLDLYTIEAGYKYRVKKVGYNDTLFELYPERKIAMNPDIDGLNYVEFSYNKETKRYTFRVTDKWAREYAGEKVYIKIELKKDIANWFDKSLGVKEYIFDVGNEYKMEFSEDDLVKPNYNNEEDTYRANEKMFETRGYYLKWGFKRIGEISKDTYVDKGKTIIINWLSSKVEFIFPELYNFKKFTMMHLKDRDYSFYDCWTGNEVDPIVEWGCRLICCIGSPNNMHSPFNSKITCFKDCQDGSLDGRNNF